jgi:hypothetical protein
MKKYFYFLASISLFLASCDSDSDDKGRVIPYKMVPNDTAKLMIKKYFSQPPAADTNYREVPRLIRFDAETVKSFTSDSNDGKVAEVNFMIAAYLDDRPFLLKNTMLLQIARENGSVKQYYFYDLREPNKSINAAGGSTLCPPPQDCIPPGTDNTK